MANLYGVANAPGLPVLVVNSGGDVTCPANVYTAVLTSTPLIAPSNGYFYAMFYAFLEITMGATLPSSIYGNAAIGAGSFSGGIGVATGGFAANGTYYVPWFGVSPVSQVAWQGAGSTVSFGLQAQTQGVTLRQYSSGYVCLYRAPDQ